MLMKNPHHPYDFEVVFERLIALAGAELPIEKMGLLALNCRVLAEDITAPLNLPLAPISAMDGYALHSSALADALQVVACNYAGDLFATKINPQQAQRIMTGALVPDGADCVIPLENAMTQQSDTGELLLNPKGYAPQLLKAGKHIKAIGSDIQQGELLLSRGTRLGAEEIALLASVGIAQVAVYRKLRVALFASGNELLEPGQHLTAGGVFNANRYLLQSLLQSLPVDVVADIQCQDDLNEMTDSLRVLSEQADLILTVGGASVGDKDWISQALQNLGAKTEAYKLRMKPAKPLTFADLSNLSDSSACKLIALPGNPLAAYFSFQLFAAPFIRKASGMTTWRKEAKQIALAQSCSAPEDKMLWLPVKQTEQGLQPIYGSMSQLTLLTQADGYIRLDAGAQLRAGDKVDYWSLRCH